METGGTEEIETTRSSENVGKWKLLRTAKIEVFSNCPHKCYMAVIQPVGRTRKTRALYTSEVLERGRPKI